MPLLAGISLGCAAEALVVVCLSGRRTRPAIGSLMLHDWCRRLVGALNLRPQVTGRPPDAGLLVVNHVSALDVLLLASQQPVIFVARAELQDSPLRKSFAGAVGTLFLPHGPAGEIDRFAAEAAALLKRDAVVVLFPEGARSDGSQVLPFLPWLLGPAAARGWPVTPAWIGYRDEARARGKGRATRGRFSRLLGLLIHEPGVMAIAYGTTQPAEADRKALARRLREEVIGLSARGQAAPNTQPPAVTVLKSLSPIPSVADPPSRAARSMGGLRRTVPVSWG